MAIISGAIGTKGLESGIKKLDVRDMIFQLEPDEAPFVSVLKEVNKAKAVDTEFSWFEDELLGRYTQVNNTPGGYDEDDTDIVVDDESFFQANDIVKVVSTGECMLISSITAGTHTITVTRGWGATAGAAIADNAYLFKLGNAQAEGFTAPGALVTQKTKVTNYLQLFSKTVEITDVAEAVSMYGGNRRNYERRKKGVELKREMEAQILWGEPKEDTSGSQKKWQTGGIYHFIKTNGASLNMNSAQLTFSAWEGFLRDLFTYGSKEKLFFCGNRILTQVSLFAYDKQRVEPGKQKVFGVSVTRYHSANGDVLLVPSQQFVGPYAGYGIACDIKDVVYRYLQGMDLSLRLDVSAKDVHAKKDEYFGMFGLEIHNAKKHGYIYGVAA